MNFPCSGCGCCCKRIGVIKKFLTEDEFPYNANLDGVCEMLIDNKCSIYETRPDICSVDKMATKHNIKTTEYYKVAITICNNLMDEDNIPLNYRIHGI